MDYMRPLPETSRYNKHIVVNHFTKWCEAFATADQKSNQSSTIFDRQNIFSIQHTGGLIKGVILKAILCMKYLTPWAPLRLEQQLTTRNATIKRNAKIERFNTCCHLLFQVEKTIGICGWTSSQTRTTRVGMMYWGCHFMKQCLVVFPDCLELGMSTCIHLCQYFVTLDSSSPKHPKNEPAQTGTSI